MDDGAKIGAPGVYGAVERVPRRGPVWTLYLAAGPNVIDVSGGKLTLVDARRGDPYVAVLLLDRQVAAREGRHSVAVDAVYDRNQLIAWMGQLEPHCQPRSASTRFS